MSEKINIYQVLPRLFGNTNDKLIPGGTRIENGCGELSDLSMKALISIHKMGFSHIWYTGVIEHASQTSYPFIKIKGDHPAVVKGIAGSPYAIRDYYDVDPDLCVGGTDRINNFKELVNRTHHADLKVIIDFVPNHVARKYHSDVPGKGPLDFGKNDNTTVEFDSNNNFYYIPNTYFAPQFDLKAGSMKEYQEKPAKATGNDVFSATPSINDWYETVKLNYGVDYVNGGTKHFDPIPSTWEKMYKILLYWAEMGVDGFRCDMAEMVPVEFWEWVIIKVKEEYPRIIFIAEVYNPAEYRNYIFKGGFDYLYDKVGLYDTLRGVICGYKSAQDITQCWQNVDDISDHMLNFLENHDEQRIASDFFAGNAEKAIPGMIVSASISRGPIMVYFGQELGERGMDEEGYSGRDGRTTIFDYWSLDKMRRWNNRGYFNTALLTADEIALRNTYSRLMTICKREKAITQGMFYDLMYVNQGCDLFNPHRTFVFARRMDKDFILIIANFDRDAKQTQVFLPRNLFDYFNLKAKSEVIATDLLTREKECLHICPDECVVTNVDGYSGKILKMTL